MNALYKSRLYNFKDAAGFDVTLEGADTPPFDVPFDDPDLIVDPTDAEVAGAENLGDWYGIDEDAIGDLRRMLSGEISLSEWQRRKGLRRRQPQTS